ncbi:MAG: TlpA family protein disulfide reductase [Gemmatimonadales bacterium]
MKWLRRAMVLAFAGMVTGFGMLAAQDTPGKGDKAPAPVVLDLDSIPVHLDSVMKQGPVFLEFWATWCASCKALMPAVREAEARFGDRVTFLGINVTVGETREGVREHTVAHDLPFRVLYDEEGVSVRAYNPPGTSYVVIIDRDGNIAYTGLGGDQRFRQVLERVAGP